MKSAENHYLSTIRGSMILHLYSFFYVVLVMGYVVIHRPAMHMNCDMKRR